MRFQGRPEVIFLFSRIYFIRSTSLNIFRSGLHREHSRTVSLSPSLCLTRLSHFPPGKREMKASMSHSDANIVSDFHQSVIALRHVWTWILHRSVLYKVPEMINPTSIVPPQKSSATRHFVKPGLLLSSHYYYEQRAFQGEREIKNLVPRLIPKIYFTLSWFLSTSLSREYLVN